MYDLTKVYDDRFYDENTVDSCPVARYLAPIIVKHFGIKKMVDYGCATGHWLGEFHRAGAKGLGIEGSSSITTRLLVDQRHILIHDLRYPIGSQDRFKTFLENGTLDLAFSFEVAEHIEKDYAEIFVDNMLSGDPRWVIMTAAPPGQGGCWHVNEQPKSYWIEKFERRGYKPSELHQRFLSEKIEHGRRLENVEPELQRPDMRTICPIFAATCGCENGVWIPPWLPDNLMIFAHP